MPLGKLTTMLFWTAVCSQLPTAGVTAMVFAAFVGSNFMNPGEPSPKSPSELVLCQPSIDG